MFAEDRQLAEHCAALAKASDEGIAWVEKNPELVRAEAPETIKVLRRSVDQFKRLEVAALRKMCVGVFGPSQNGKSYLISSLARAGDNPLMANFNGKLIDFLADINPVGDKEATGLVTRFTIDRPQNLPADHPVQLRLLTETDIVKIIGNTYYSDFDHKDTPDADPAAVSKRLDELQAKVQSAPVDKLRPHNIGDLEEYFRKFRVNQRVKVLSSVFWARAALIAPGLGLDDRAKLYATIWGDIDSLTDLFKRLYSALKALDFAPEAFTTLDALMPREKSIIDVATLGGLGTNEGDKLALVTREGRKTQLLRSETTALTTELIIVVDQRPFDFFDHTDLLDFPGARPIPAGTDAWVYADLWERSVDALEDGALRDPGLHGADTTTRTQTMVQVKWWPVGAEPADPCANPRIGDATVQVRLPDASSAAVDEDGCVAVDGSSVRIGNYLFRVEVHEVEPLAEGAVKLTLKWSGENGAEQCAVAAEGGAAPDLANVPEEFLAGPWSWELCDDAGEKRLGVHPREARPAARPLLSRTPQQTDLDPTVRALRRWDGHARFTVSRQGAVTSAVDGQDHGQTFGAASGAASTYASLGEPMPSADLSKALGRGLAMGLTKRAGSGRA